MFERPAGARTLPGDTASWLPFVPMGTPPLLVLRVYGWVQPAAEMLASCRDQSFNGNMSQLQGYEPAAAHGEPLGNPV